MKTLTLIVLLFTSQFAIANVTEEELICVAKSTYHEVRSLSEKDWLKTANVAYNRKLKFNEYNFGAKSNHLCDIVKSRQYSSRHKLKYKLKERKLYEKIILTLKTKNWRTTTKAVYFTTTNKKVNYKEKWIK